MENARTVIRKDQVSRSLTDEVKEMLLFFIEGDLILYGKVTDATLECIKMQGGCIEQVKKLRRN